MESLLWRFVSLVSSCPCQQLGYIADGSQDWRLTILHAATHETERGDHDSRSIVNILKFFGDKKVHVKVLQLQSVSSCVYLVQNTCPHDSLVADEIVKRPQKQTKQCKAKVI